MALVPKELLALLRNVGFLYLRPLGLNFNRTEVIGRWHNIQKIQILVIN